MTTTTQTTQRSSRTPAASPVQAAELTIAMPGSNTAAHLDRLENLLAERERRIAWRPGPGRVELFRYRDLLIRISQGAAVHHSSSEDRLAARFCARLTRPAPFYTWRPETVIPADEVFSAIVVNRMAPRHRDRVAELFSRLDATDFPATMGTRVRRLYSVAPDVYLHVQEFAQADGLAVIDEAWRDSDPRFLQICEDLTPIVPAYDETCTEHEDHVAKRFFVRSTR